MGEEKDNKGVRKSIHFSGGEKWTRRTFLAAPGLSCLRLTFNPNQNQHGRNGLYFGFIIYLLGALNPFEEGAVVGEHVGRLRRAS